jgi:cell wall-associated NlpC family hydrolase
MPTRIFHFRRFLLLLAGASGLLTTPAEAGFPWPFRRARPPAPVAVPPSYQQPYAAAAPPMAWHPQPYYPPAPAAVYGGYAFGERPAIPAPRPDASWQPVVYRPSAPPPRVPSPSPVPAPASGSLFQTMARECERLSRMGLSYQFGSMDPARGGLDCSGSVKCVLERTGVRGVPRTASDQYVWLQNSGTLTPLRRGANPDWILSRLRPGDLLFWRGTYVTNRYPDVSHVMIYLGRDRRTGKPMMFGARSSTSSSGIHGHAVHSAMI